MIGLFVTINVRKWITLREEIEAYIYWDLWEYYEIDVVLLHGNLHLLFGKECDDSRVFNFKGDITYQLI